MTDLEKILERAEFNKEAVVNVAKHEDSDGYFGFLSGAEWQHGELMPIMRSLCEVIKMLRGALEQTDCEDKVAARALVATDKRLKRIGG